MLLEQEFEDFKKTLEGLDVGEKEKRVYYFGMFIMLAHLEELGKDGHSAKELEEYVVGVREELGRELGRVKSETKS